MNVATAIVRELEELGVKRVYGLIGTSIIDFVDALGDSKIRYYTTRFDQSAVSMAVAEGKVLGSPGIAAVHGGPGFLNSLTAVATAFKDSIPVIVISGAVKRRLSGLNSWLEVDQRAIANPIVKSFFRLDNPSEPCATVANAYAIASDPPAGPVVIEVPEDSWGAEAGDSVVMVRSSKTARASEEQVAQFLVLLKLSRSPLVLAGGGINNRKGSELLMRFVEKYGIPVATTGNGRGALPEDHPLSLGRAGFGGGNTVADGAISKCDLLIAFGAGLSDVSSYGYNYVPASEIVAVTLDPDLEKKPVPYSLLIKADISDFLEQLFRHNADFHPSQEWLNFIYGKRAEWSALCEAAIERKYEKYVNPSNFFDALEKKLPDNYVLTAGQGFHILYAHAFLKIRSPASFLASTNLGAMGYALPAALGAKTSKPGSEVLAVIGDGEFMMTLQELETAVREKISARIIVVNDNSYRVLLMRQNMQKMGRVKGTILTNPDFVKLGESFGIDTFVLARDDGIGEAVNFILAKREGPSLLELRVSPQDVPPFNMEASLRF
jgi:acetolactate synthase I/II/III large subunit